MEESKKRKFKRKKKEKKGIVDVFQFLPLAKLYTPIFFPPNMAFIHKQLRLAFDDIIININLYYI